MIINKKKVINITPYIGHIKDGSKIVFGVTDAQRFSKILEKIGFTPPYQDGQVLLPSGQFGSVSLYNSEGKEIIERDQPKETLHRDAIWSWDQWNGPYETIKRSEVVDIPYKRYPRTFVEPPSVEMVLRKLSDGELLIVSHSVEKSSKNLDHLKHIINLFLEVFGECELLAEDLTGTSSIKTVRLNWQVLPKGEMPWDSFEKIIKPIIDQAPKGDKVMMEYRLKVMNELKPDFRAIGRAGFHGYIVHGFTQKGLFVLESLYYGNATYLFDEKWEELSKMTKAEILRASLQLGRVVHHKNWKARIGDIVSSRKEKN